MDSAENGLNLLFAFAKGLKLAATYHGQTVSSGQYVYVLNQCVHDGADINTKDEQGNTLLHIECLQYEGAYKKRILSLLEKGADPLLPNRKGSTALMLILKSTHVKNIMRERKSDKRFYQCESCKAILHAALEQKRVDLLNLQDEQGQTALFYATTQYNWQACSDLLAAGADPNLKNINGETALLRALQEPETQNAFNIFSNYPIDATVCDKQKHKSILSYAIERNQKALVSNILKHSTSETWATNADDDGVTPLMYAAGQHQIAGNYVSALVKKGVPLESKDKVGRNAIHYAVQSMTPKHIQLLAKDHAELLNAKDHEGFTPLLTLIATSALEQPHGLPQENFILWQGCLRAMVEAGLQTTAAVNSGYDLTDFVQTMRYIDTNLGAIIFDDFLLEGEESRAVRLKTFIDSVLKTERTILRPQHKKRLQNCYNVLVSGWRHFQECFDLKDSTKDTPWELVQHHEITELMFACWTGNTKKVRGLLRAKVDIQVKDRVGRNALFYAVMAPNADCLKMLLKAQDGAINDKDQNRYQILDYLFLARPLPLWSVLNSHRDTAITGDMDAKLSLIINYYLKHKLKLFDTEWDVTLEEGCQIFALPESSKALQQYKKRDS